MNDSHQAQGLTRNALALLFLTILIVASFWVLHLFLTAIVWAAMIVVSTWPIMLSLQRRLWGKRSLAVGVMTLVLLMVLIVPLVMAVSAIVVRYEEILDWIKSLATFSLPPPPDWVGALPMVGSKIVAHWEHVIAIGPEGVSAFLTPYAGNVLSWFVAMSGSVGTMVIQFLLTVFIAAIFYMCGEGTAEWFKLFARRIAGTHGEESLILAASAIRAVALGVVGTAIIQAFLGGLGLIITGIPAAGILTALIFMFCLAQVGPVPVLIPAVIWLFWMDQTTWGFVLAGWTVFLGISDNIITPVLMKKGADLPMLLVFAGVTGGLMVFGIIGLFIGPVVLAVSYTLLDSWVSGEAPPGATEIQ